jgi:hypothetical protein
MSSTTEPAPPAAGLPPLGPLGRLRIVAEVLAAYPAALARLRSNDLDRMIRAARTVRTRPAVLPPALEHQLAARLGVAVLRTLRLLPTDSRCLIRCLVLSRLLARRGIPARLVIGVKPGRDFAAHAWIEHDGRPVLPPGRFERLMEM